MTIFEYEKGQDRDNSLSSDVTAVDTNGDTEDNDTRVLR